MKNTNAGRNRIPKILLAGIGRFGQHHLGTWRVLESEGLVKVAGALVSSRDRRQSYEDRFKLPVFTQVPKSLLRDLDGVDIATPSATHFRLARLFLKHTNVLLEKPLATSAAHAEELEAAAVRSGRILMVNHLYRFHPSVQRLKQMVTARKDRPRLVTGVMVNPRDPDREGLCPSLEFLHHFDILDEFFGGAATVITSQTDKSLRHVSLRYPRDVNAHVTIGWHGSQRVRTLEIEYPDVRWAADLQETAILEYTGSSFDRIQLAPEPRPLEASLRAFLKAISGARVKYPDATIGQRVVNVALASRPGKATKRRPRVGVIGGGIFGASCAIELAPHCDVTLFERHDDLLTEATFLNQWRYHSGFHYPRSMETVQEIKATRDDFESMYGEAVMQDVVSYYCTSIAAGEITRERYLAVCRANELQFGIEGPPEGILDPAQVSLSLRTDEGVFHFYKLREMVQDKLKAFKSIDVRLSSEVIHGAFEDDGSKRLTIRNGRQKTDESFDYVINTTYANLNLYAKWFRFPVRRLRFDLCEMLVMEIDMPQVSVTILDGPFTSLVSTGQNNLFILSQVHESVLRSAIPADGLPPKWGPYSSNRISMLRQCKRYLPILETGRIVESRFATRAVRAFSEDFDGRPTVVTSHGFGCWSVLGGKIATSVSNARSIACQMMPHVYAESNSR